MADATGSPAAAGGSHDGGSPSGGGAREREDRFLPVADISRIMRKAIPPNGKMDKDAKEAVQELVSEFISFITSEASDKCKREMQKTMTGDDLLWAMATLGFEDYIEPLKLYLHKYREGFARRRSSATNPNLSVSGCRPRHPASSLASIVVCCSANLAYAHNS